MEPFPPALQPAFAAFEAGRFTEAEQLCRSQMEAAPSGELFFLLGLIANKTARHADSVGWLERAAEKLPPSLRLLSALGGAYRAAGQTRRAAECFAQCLKLAPQNQQACQQLADACYELREYAHAASLYRRALQVEPENPALWNNLANTLRNLCEVDEAITAYDRALPHRPDDPRIRANRGSAFLLAGRLDEGFREFEFRWHALGLRTFPQPIWRGENLPGKTLFVFAEQGHGDTIQFVRYLKMARPRLGKIMLECQPALKLLLEDSGCADTVIAAGETLPAFDCYAPLMHLPSIFRTTLETVPAVTPYLMTSKKIKFPETAVGNLKVGLAWAGNPDFLDNAIRSIPLNLFAEILKTPRVSFFNLQLKVPPSDEQFFRLSPFLDFMSSAKDFNDTAAIIAPLDLVISVDTAVTHLGGALGKRVWTLLSTPPDWRWLLHRTDTPWYPGMRLFRQRAAGNWQSVISEVAATLRQFASS